MVTFLDSSSGSAKEGSITSMKEGVEVSIVADNLDLSELLKESVDGRQILASSSLTPTLRNKLVTIVINNELKNHPDCNISHQRLTQLAHHIVKLFTNESIESYYSPYSKTSDGVKRSAKGKLFDKYNALRRQLKKPSSGSKQEPTDTCQEKDSDKETEYDAETCMLWLKHNAQPWSEVVDKWSKTTRTRLNNYANSDCSIAEYIMSYPALYSEKGYTLFEIDFKKLHPDKEMKMSDNITSFCKKIIICAQKSHDPIIKKYLSMMNEKTTEDVRHAICFLILPYLLSTSVISTGSTRKKKWRPSKQESQQNFLLHLSTTEELKPALERRQEKCRELQESCQPLPIIVGNLETNTLKAFIEVNSTLYSVDSILKCIDVCYKLFYCLNANYPAESSHVWHFVQKFIYDMTTIYDTNYQSVTALISDLNSITE